MAVKSYKVGPGTLSLGAANSPIEISGQTTSAVVKWSEDAEDDVPVLSGEQLDGEVDYTATLSGTLLQDLTEGGLIDYTWENKGTWVPFSYVPNAAAARSINGEVRLTPLDVGGEAKTRPTSDFEWAARQVALATSV